MLQATACSAPARAGNDHSRHGFRLNLWGLLFFAAALQLAAIYLLDSGPLLRIVLPAAHVLLVPFLVANRRLIGMRLIAVGLMLNLAVMVANGGLMPVEPAAVSEVGRHDVASLEAGSHIPGTKNVLLAPGDTQLLALADRTVIAVPGVVTKAVSVGDFFVLGGALLCLAEMGRRHIRSAHRLESAANTT